MQTPAACVLAPGVCASCEGCAHLKDAWHVGASWKDPVVEHRSPSQLD